jgi:peptidoglycan/LPS O-acetylase OafA/YrhL
LIWLLGLIPGMLYVIFNPDGLLHVDRYSEGPWLQALKDTPMPHLASFVFGMTLAALDVLVPRNARIRIFLGLFGFISIFITLWFGPYIPYAIIHDGLLMPLFGCVVIGVSGQNVLSSILGSRPLIFVGVSSYCLYLLHFNFWNLIHDTHVLDRVGLARLDPWISYVILVALAILAYRLIERPVQKILRRWMHAGEAPAVPRDI